MSGLSAEYDVVHLDVAAAGSDAFWPVRRTVGEARTPS